MNNSLLGTLALVTLLAGCADTVWQKTGSTDDDFKKVDYECERDTRQSVRDSSSLGGALVARDFYRKCMVSKGYSISK